VIKDFGLDVLAHTPFSDWERKAGPVLHEEAESEACAGRSPIPLALVPKGMDEIFPECGGADMPLQCCLSGSRVVVPMFKKGDQRVCSSTTQPPTRSYMYYANLFHSGGALLLI